MKLMKLNVRRFLAIFLSLVMLLAVVPSYALGVSAAEEAYRTDRRDDDEMSLTCDNTTYYFDTVDSAFVAVENKDAFSNDVTLTLLADSKYELTKSQDFFSGFGGTVTLDLNGKNLTFRANDGATSRYSITPESALILTDGTASGKANDNTLNAGSIMLENTYVSLANKTNIKSVNMEAGGEVNASSAYIISSTSKNELRFENSKFTLDSTIKAKNVENIACLNISSSTEPIYIKDCNFAAGNYTGIKEGHSAFGPLNLESNVVIAENGNAIATASRRGLVIVNIKNENYKAKNWINIAGDDAQIEIDSGIFYGDIQNTSASANIVLHGGIFEKDPSETQGVTYSGCTKSTVADGQYSGWTKFSIGLSEYNATINKGEYGGALTIEKDGKEIFDLDTFQVYGSVETAYTLTLEAGFSIEGISITTGETTKPIPLNEVGGYKVINDTTASLTIINPESDYTLNFTIGFDQTGGETVASKGEKTYTALIAAFADLKAGEILTLERNVECVSSITLKRKNLTLDLNGKSLLFSDDSNGILINGGGFTVKDTSAEQTGSIISGGITLDGSDSEFELQSGTLSGKSPEVNVTMSAKNSVIKVSGGKINGQVNGYGYTTSVLVSGGVIIGNNALRICGSLTMTGGEVRTETGPSAVKLDLTDDSCSASITGGRIIALNGNYGIYIQDGVGAGKVIIGGDAEIISTESSAFHVGSTVGNNRMSITISDHVRLSGKEYALEIDEKNNKPASIAINGGHYQFGEDYLAVSNTYHVTYPEGYVMNTAADTSGNYTGYYTLATKESLGGHNDETNADYTYQDYAGNYPGGGLGGGLDDILASAKAIVDEGNADNKYPENDFWVPFLETYEFAKQVRYIEGDPTTNPNANQTEIDFRARQLTLAIQKLENYTTVDLNNLADGTYSIQISAYKYNMSGLSMAAGAFYPNATLVIKNGRAYITIHVHPMNMMGVWGRLLDFWTFDGATPDEAKGYWNNNELAMRVQADLSNWYAHTGESENKADVTFAKDKGLKDEKSETYPYPGAITVKLPYLGTTTEESTLYSRVNVDVMGEEQNLLILLAWSTLTEVSVNPTLTVTPDSLTMLPGEKQTITAELKGSVSDGYTVSKWESDNASVATVKDGEVTAVGAGSCTITVTATKDGAEDLVKTVSVTVMPEGSTAVDVRNVTSSGSSESAELSGNALLTGGSDRVTVNGDTVTFDVKSDGKDITSSKVVIDAETAKALEGKTAVIGTNTGTITLDSALLAKIAATGGKVTLTISKTGTPDSSLGQFTAAYELSLTDAGGKAVDFGDGRATVAVPVFEDVSWAYCIADGKRTDHVAVAMNNGTATFTVSHFSVWALSTREYEVGGETGSEFFLEDGNYYVDVYLWKENGNEASMGDIAFRNNRKALVTVKNGKITRVQIATNPVFIDPYYSAIISFRLADGTEVTTLATGEITTSPAGNHYKYIKLVSFDLPESAQPDIRDAVTYIPVIFYVPDTPMDAAVGEDLIARLRFEWSTAEKVEDEKLNPDDNTASDTESVVLKDEKTGIELETNTGILDKNAILSVEVLTKGSDYDFALRALSDVDAKWTIYNITTLLNGLTVDPTGAVTLRIPCNNADGFIVYLINADGSKTKLNGSVQDGYFVIRARSLGLIAVGTANDGNSGNGNGIGNNGSTQSPQTGDNSYLAVWFLLMLASGGALLVLILGKKRKNIIGE